MKTKISGSLIKLSFVMLLFILFSFNTEKTTKCHVWERWQMTLKSTRAYENPYKDVELTVEFTGPKGKNFKSPAFWNGDSTFIIRTAFPTVGKWHWETLCSDTLNVGLNNRFGEVIVKRYKGHNPLYKNGFLKIGRNKRYLVYNNGKPFFWLGGTAWVAPLKASLEDWETYIDDRVDKDFSVVQISPASGWGGSVDVKGNPVFLSKGLNKWNPAYWNEFDKKVQYANEKGIVVFIVGIMEPVKRYPSDEKASIFARNLAGRMSGNFVIFSPSFDSPFMELGNKVGKVLKKVVKRHLITQHPNTPSHHDINVTAVKYYHENYMDFSMDQSGHNGGNRNLCVWNAIHWNLDLYYRSKMPVINGEAYYEADTTTSDRPQKYNGTTRDARQLAYMSILSGSMGYTYGAMGLWNWETDSTKGSYWKKAMQYPGSIQMKYMYDFFSKIDWWKLEPKPDLILNQHSDILSTLTLAESSNKDLIVAHLPKEDTIRINLNDFSFPARVIWFDPISNQYIQKGIIENKKENEFIAPGLPDAILLLKRL